MDRLGDILDNYPRRPQQAVASIDRNLNRGHQNQDEQHHWEKYRVFC